MDGFDINITPRCLILIYKVFMIFEVDVLV